MDEDKQTLNDVKKMGFIVSNPAEYIDNKNQFYKNIQKQCHKFNLEMKLFQMKDYNHVINSYDQKIYLFICEYDRFINEQASNTKSDFIMIHRSKILVEFV